ncbi:uncharacterized protein LOC127256245 [Andrographis paniculata]|uniref:uncharacterized protein LOC127256245 n=1 Tax=Andrographis paniculata TaxID=175694 RepID=UPI0021E86D22|nr:uncharacterized protein LOC127256245 [Andrographis paniculata]
MGCLKPQHLLYKTINPKPSSSSSSLFPCRPLPLLHPNFFPSTSTVRTTTTSTASSSSSYNVTFKTRKSCKLGISIFPDFDYNAESGSGSGLGSSSTTKTSAVDRIDDKNGTTQLSVMFDAQRLYIPPMSFNTARFLGLPLPPFLRIDIVPEALYGTIDRESGEIELNFKAEFWFSVGTVYKAPPMLVDTVLTTEESRGKMRGGKGERMQKDGSCRLVGIATVDPIDDVFMDTFLGLPTECLAVLNAVIAFSDA